MARWSLIDIWTSRGTYRIMERLKYKQSVKYQIENGQTDIEIDNKKTSKQIETEKKREKGRKMYINNQREC